MFPQQTVSPSLPTVVLPQHIRSLELYGTDPQQASSEESFGKSLPLQQIWSPVLYEIFPQQALPSPITRPSHSWPSVRRNLVKMTRQPKVANVLAVILSKAKSFKWIWKCQTHNVNSINKKNKCEITFQLCESFNFLFPLTCGLRAVHYY